MKASEILRSLADLIDSAEQPQNKAQQAIQAVKPQQVPTQNQTPNLVAIEVDSEDNSEAGVFVPPLQAKLELLKKSVGVDSVYDQGGADEQLTGNGADVNGQEDDLVKVKKLAGIHVASEDNDITG